MSPSSQETRSAPPIRIAVWASLLVLAVMVPAAWVSEDAYITFRTIDQFVHGNGPIWNPGERVQAYTHPLWMFLLTAAHTGTGELFYTSIAVSLLLALIAVWLLFRYSPTVPGTALALLLLVTSKAFIDYTTSGLENPLTFLLLAAFYTLYLSREPPLRTLGVLSLVAALAAVNRYDTILFFLPPLALAALPLIKKRPLQTAGILAAGMTPLFAWMLFALVYYGFVFPNTAYAKLATGIERLPLLQQGLWYAAHSLRNDAVTIGALGIGGGAVLYWGGNRLRACMMGAALYIGYTVWVGGDFMAGRFFAAPMFATVFVLARMEWRWRTAVPVAIAVALWMPFQPHPTLTYGINRSSVASDPHGIVDERMFYFDQLGLIRALEHESMPASPSRVQGEAVRASGKDLLVSGIVGVFGYYAGREIYIVDPYGLTDPFLARLPIPDKTRWRIGHFERGMPEGYIETLASGENRLENAALAQYYDDLRRITRGPLWDAERWRAIWRVHRGAHNLTEE